MDPFEKVAPYLTDPLVLSGFALFLMAGLFRAFLKSDRLSATLPADSGRILLAVVWVMGAAAVLTIILGFKLASDRQQQPVRPVVDAGQLIARLEEQAQQNGALKRDRDRLSEQKAALEATVRQLVEQSSRPDSPPGLADALAQSQKTGDPSGVITLLTLHAEALAADARQSNQAAAASLRQAATLARWTDTRAALAAIRRATELDPDHLWFWIERGRLEMQSGDHSGARRSFGAVLERAKRVRNERMEGVAFHEIGEVLLATGDLKAALDAFEKYGAVAERLAARAPENAVWQLDRSVAHNKVGDLRVAMGDIAGAQRSYEASLSIAERLVARGPENAVWQHGVSVGHERIGDLRVALGDIAGAQRSYEASLAISELLVARDPTNAEWQRDLSIGHEKVGSLCLASGELAGARRSYEASLAIRERLASLDPTNVEWQRDLSVSHSKIGNLRVALGDLAGAQRSYKASLAITERLAVRDSENAEWQRDRVVFYSKIAGVQARLPDGRREALGWYRRALAVVEAMKVAGKWAPADEPHVETLRQRIAALEAEDTTAAR